MIEQYDQFLNRNTKFGSTLRDLFTQFDINKNGVLEEDELDSLESSGEISAKQINMVKSWDTDESNTISKKEFKMGPLFLSVLDMNIPKRDEYFLQKWRVVVM